MMRDGFPLQHPPPDQVNLFPAITDTLLQLRFRGAGFHVTDFPVLQRHSQMQQMLAAYLQVGFMGRCIEWPVLRSA